MTETQHQPLITVVTVVYNDAAHIEQTMLSVLNQTYPNIEYIIIDGGSTDGTVDIIKKYADRLAYWVSEPDKGIYDAMNKGVKAATGEWINFMNCGDCFVSDDTLLSIFELHAYNCDVIYGDTVKRFSSGKYLSKHEGVEILEKRLPFCHQSCFISKNAAQSNLYDIHYKIAADYNQFYTIYSNGGWFVGIDIPISVFDNINGRSSLHEDELIKEYCSINGSKLFPEIFKFKVKRIIKLILEIILPNALYGDVLEKRKIKNIGVRYE